MFKYTYGKRLSDDLSSKFKQKLLEAFAQDYDIQSNRMWNCLKVKSVCMEFEKAKKLNTPIVVMFYLERQNEVYITTFKDICKYVEGLEPWEYIDAYVFDNTFSWLIAITHEDLKCLVIGV